MTHTFPLYVFWELTRDCNLRCIHCYAIKEAKRELSFKEVSLIMKKLKKMKTLVINFSGGEIFMREDFFQIARLARKENFAIKIFTNGTMLGPKEVSRLEKLKPLYVEVSIYSSVPEVHDAITRSKGSWKRSTRAIHYFIREGLRVRIKCSIMQENFSTFRETFEFISRLGVSYQFNPVLMPKVDGSSEPLQHGLDKTQRAFIINNLAKGLSDERSRKEKLSSPMCSAGITSCTINAYGELMPCISFPIKLGNILREDFEEIWSHNKFLCDIRKLKNKDLSVCGNCKLLTFCSRCPGIAFLTKRDYLSSYEEACHIATLKKELLHSHAD